MTRESLAYHLANKDVQDRIIKVCKAILAQGDNGKMYSPVEGKKVSLLSNMYWHGYGMDEISKMVGVQ